MYGAGRLERGNIVEYEEAAEFARACGREDFIDCLLTMAEVEWEHELYFRDEGGGTRTGAHHSAVGRRRRRRKTIRGRAFAGAA